jgi:thiosulfate reductase cytochrome b subunit
MKRLDLKHPLAIRWFHWINVAVVGAMIWSGWLIYWANDVYRVGWGTVTLFPFFPQRFYDAFGIPYHLARGMAWHFFFMWVFALNGALNVL